MTRHSKNNTAGSIFTYHERKKVKDFNTLKQRLGSSSMRKFEQCWLCLATAVKPVTTPSGYIYCKECILMSLAKQMEKNKKLLSQWESDMKMWQKKEDEKKEQEELEKKRKLVIDNLYSLDSAKKPNTNVETKKNVFKEDLDYKPGANFWGIDSSSKSNSKERKTEGQPPPKPKNLLSCPISGRPLKVKDLIDLDPDTRSTSDSPSSEVVWLCSVSKKPILHNQAYAYKKNGKIVMKQYVGATDNPQDTESFVSLVPAGTAFSSHNNVEAKKFRPCMQ
ncbi:Nitric oxide synthase-interacting protein-like protein [Theileria parva strain Muguga]|nr:Nitric oxide synthase-interacting protein-like protein [Theileria parva strain Muguga]EAN31623.2 Nitric oxide synthase-interacting protein-like protein [Theileria parva strain Muguga]